MICSVRSASCQTVKAMAMATVAASAHHWAAAGWLVLAVWLAGAGFAEGGPGGGELADGEVAQPGGQRGEHEHHRPGREPAGQQQREGRQQPGRGQQRGHHGDGAEQPAGPSRVLLRRRRRRYGIVCLSDLSDPCGTWPMTHEPTIGPAVAWPVRRTRNGRRVGVERKPLWCAVASAGRGRWPDGWACAERASRRLGLRGRGGRRVLGRPGRPGATGPWRRGR